MTAAAVADDAKPAKQKMLFEVFSPWHGFSSIINCFSRGGPREERRNTDSREHDDTVETETTGIPCANAPG